MRMSKDVDVVVGMSTGQSVANSTSLIVVMLLNPSLWPTLNAIWCSERSVALRIHCSSSHSRNSLHVSSSFESSHMFSSWSAHVRSPPVITKKTLCSRSSTTCERENAWYTPIRSGTSGVHMRESRQRLFTLSPLAPVGRHDRSAGRPCLSSCTTSSRHCVVAASFCASSIACESNAHPRARCTVDSEYTAVVSNMRACIGKIAALSSAWQLK